MRTVWAVLVLVCAVACGSSEDPESIELGDDAARRKLADVDQKQQPVPEEPVIEQPASDAGAVPAPVQDASVPAPQQDAAAAPVADASVPAPDASAPVTPDAAAPVADASTPADASVTPDAAVVEPEPAGLTFYDGRPFEYEFQNTSTYHHRRLTLHVDEGGEFGTLERFDLVANKAMRPCFPLQTAPNEWSYTSGAETCVFSFQESTDRIKGYCSILIDSGAGTWYPSVGTIYNIRFLTKRAI